jgi:hypothetical protein
VSRRGDWDPLTAWIYIKQYIETEINKDLTVYRLTLITEIRNFERFSNHRYCAAQKQILDPTTYCDKTGLRHRKENNSKTQEADGVSPAASVK